MRQNPSSLSRIPASGLPRPNVDAIRHLRPVFRPLTRFPVFPVETGNFVDFSHSTVVWPRKGLGKSARCEPIPVAAENGNSRRPNRELNAPNRELPELTAKIILSKSHKNRPVRSGNRTSKLVLLSRVLPAWLLRIKP